MDRARANRSGFDRARVFGTSSAKMIVNRARTTVTMTSDRPSALPSSTPALRRTTFRPWARLTAAYAEAKKPMTVRPSCDTARNRPGSSRRRRTRRAPALPSSTSCSTRLRRTETSAISAATKNPSRRVSRTMIRMSRHRSGPGSSRGVRHARRRPRDCGSRIRAGIPTASLPAGTSRVTTAPAPVFASSPIVIGARSIVSTPEEDALADRRPVLASGRRSWP